MNLQATNINGWFKDTDTGLVINKNEEDFRRFEEQKAQYKEYKRTQAEIANVKKEMEELKQLVLRKMSDV